MNHHQKVATLLRAARSYMAEFGHNTGGFCPDINLDPKQADGLPVCAVGALAVSIGSWSWWGRHFKTEETTPSVRVWWSAQDALAKAAGLPSIDYLPDWSDNASTDLVLETFQRAAISEEHEAARRGYHSTVSHRGVVFP